MKRILGEEGDCKFRAENPWEFARVGLFSAEMARAYIQTERDVAEGAIVVSTRPTKSEFWPPGWRINTETLEWEPVTKRAEAVKKCECGVHATGGLHSDWCPIEN